MRHKPQYATRPHPSQPSKVLWTAWVGDGEQHRKSLEQGHPTSKRVVLRVASSGAHVERIIAKALASGTIPKRAQPEQSQRVLNVIRYLVQDEFERNSNLQQLLQQTKLVKDQRDLRDKIASTCNTIQHKWNYPELNDKLEAFCNSFISSSDAVGAPAEGVNSEPTLPTDEQMQGVKQILGTYESDWQAQLVRVTAISFIQQMEKESNDLKAVNGMEVDTETYGEQTTDWTIRFPFNVQIINTLIKKFVDNSNPMGHRAYKELAAQTVPQLIYILLRGEAKHLCDPSKVTLTRPVSAWLDNGQPVWILVGFYYKPGAKGVAGSTENRTYIVKIVIREDDHSQIQQSGHLFYNFRAPLDRALGDYHSYSALRRRFNWHREPIAIDDLYAIH